MLILETLLSNATRFSHLDIDSKEARDSFSCDLTRLFIEQLPTNSRVNYLTVNSPLTRLVRVGPLAELACATSTDRHDLVVEDLVWPPLNANRIEVETNRFDFDLSTKYIVQLLLAKWNTKVETLLSLCAPEEKLIIGLYYPWVLSNDRSLLFTRAFFVADDGVLLRVLQ